jgi:cyanate permease
MVKRGISGHESLIDGGSQQPYQLRYRWVMLGLVWLSYFTFGVYLRSISPLITPILADLNISYSQMGLILGAEPLTYIVVAAIGGALIDRWGLRKCLFVGIIIMGLSELLRFFVSGFTTMFLCVALLGLGAPMVSIGCPKTASTWFKGKDRATAVGIYMTGPTVGGLLAYSMTNSVVMPITNQSWRLTFAGYSLLAFTAALLWWFLARDIKPKEAAVKTSIVKVFTGLIGIRNVKLILVLGFLTLFISHGFNDWLPKILETGGLPPVLAGFAASIPALAGLPITLFAPRMVPPCLRGRIVAILSIVSIAAILIIPTTSGTPLLLGLILLGTMASASTPLIMLMLMDTPEVETKHMGSAAGLYYCISPIGQFVGPWVVGYFVDLTGGFLAGAGFLAGLCLIKAAVALLIKTKPVLNIEVPTLS